MEQELYSDKWDEFRRPESEAQIKSAESIDYGAKLNIDWRRSGVLVNQEQATKYFPQAKTESYFKKHIYIANVKQYEDFYIAEVPIEGINEIFVNRYQVIKRLEIFRMNHVGMRFVLKDGFAIRYRVQIAQERLADFATDLPAEKRNQLIEFKRSSIIFGVYALGKPGTYFSIEASKKRQLISAYMFFTPDHLMAMYMRDAGDENMHEIKLDLSVEEIQKTFTYVVREADAKKYSEVYGIAGNNCIHSLMRLLDIGSGRWVAREKKRKNLKDSGSWSDKLVWKYNEFMADKNHLSLSGIYNGFGGSINKELYRRGLLLSKSRDWVHVKDQAYLAKILKDIQAANFYTRLKQFK